MNRKAFFKAYRINMLSYKSCTVNCSEGLPLKDCIHLEIFSNGPVAKHYTKLNSEVTMIKGRIYRHVHVALFFSKSRNQNIQGGTNELVRLFTLVNII